MKKKLILLLFCMVFSFHSNAQQWIDDNSCDKQASKILNEAITHLANLEHLMAIGMAKAALIVDNDCECAKLVAAGAASNNSDWGSRSEKLKQVNTNLLSDVEKTWFMLLSTPNDKYSNAAKKAVEMHPDSALINWITSSNNDLELMKKFAKKFPNNAAAAYNAMAYSYAREGDYDNAYQSLDKSLQLHDGPNALDSRAEIAAMENDFQKAFDNQVKAYDVAPFASPYQPKLVTYARNLNKENLVSGLKEAQIAVQDAIENQDLEEWKKYISKDMTMTAGDSSLTEFYDQTEERFSEKRNFTWNEFKLRDINVNFSPDMSMAVLTFYANGSYTFNDSNKMVDYSTRASAVWIATNSGWKMVHTNWAPFGGSGIPK